MLGAQEKLIHLRNETLHTPPPAAPAGGPALQAAEPASGLFLLQFTGRFDPAWRPPLAALGVNLLMYVPEDAFIARLEGVDLGAVRGLPFVHWVGDYRPELKLHPGVGSWLRNPGAGDVRQLNVMLSSRATPGERMAVAALFRTVEHQRGGRFAGLMRGAVSRAQVQGLLLSPAVLWVEPAPQPRLVDEVASKIVAGDGGSQQLLTQALGFDGRGVRVAVADSGIDTGDMDRMHPDIAGRVVSLFYYGDLQDASDGHSHGTHVTGIIAGDGATGETDENGFLYGLGVAPGVEIIGQRIFDDAGGYQPPPSNGTLTRDAVQAGADIGSNSWGDDTQGRYDISASEFDALVRDADDLTEGDQQYILEFSAGNAGPGSQTIGSPAVAKNVIATGASENDRPDLFIYSDGIETMADFSSRGPCEDGRIKPDIVAPGTWISSLKSRLATDENAWAGISDNYIYQGGTSQAGPHASGAAAVFVQYYRETFGQKPSPAMVKAAFINSAVDMDDASGTGPVPNNDEGWGRLDLTRLIASETRRTEFIDQTATLGTGQVYEHRVVVLDGEEQFKVTLAYTDVPGFPGAIPALVNDLDLEVVAPDGTLYRGNQFQAGESIPNPAGVDRVNNVEGVHLYTPAAGAYLVRVRAHNVPQDSRLDTPGVDQDFALAISGSLPDAGQAAILLDRGSYTVPSVVRVSVLDPTMTGHASINVTISSGTEPSGELLTLRPSALSTLFTGAVATVTGPAAADGRLQVADRDEIRVSYGTLTRTARADLSAPVILNVTSVNEFSTTTVGWDTDEPASSIVYYGQGALTFSVTNRVLGTNHSVSLTGLVENKLYHYIVVSVDEAGNRQTNNNGGPGFTFTAPVPKTFLLVDAYTEDSIFGTVTIPLSSYTNAIAAAGISFDVWPVETRGEPAYANLKPYRVVMWRINDSDQFASLSAASIGALTNYLAGGGAFLMASMEVLSRVPDATFREGVLHVGSFVEDTGAAVVTGIAGDPFSDGFDFAVDYSNYPDYSDLGGPNGDFSDEITPSGDADPMFLADGGAVVGVRYPKGGLNRAGRSIYLSFPFDGVSTTGIAPNTQAGLLQRLMAFLAPGSDGAASVVFDNRRYGLPSVAVLEVGDSNLKGAGTVTVKVRSTTDAAGITLVLPETGEPGVFQGPVTLVKASEAPGAGRLRAVEGDTVTAEFVDPAAGGGTVRATAVIDTVPPVLVAAPVVEPDFESAVVSWDTSEESDALVEFGETTRLGRTAYDSSLGTAHSLSLDGLGIDRVYYFRVTSRDRAGNAVVDDNQGKLYTFRTLKPLPLPWSDDLEHGDGAWTVFDSDGSGGTWVLGVPHNGQQSAAHSPRNAWGSNLDGGPIDFVESFLLGPGLDLTGGNKVTLRFWHSYDFLSRSDYDILDGGEVLLVTNATTTPITLASYTEDISDWVQEEIDLTPYLGHVSYVVFHYVLFSLDTVPRPGWLIDDVSIGVETVVAGTLEITNTLAEARFSITGPTTRTGRGLSYRDTNAPPGDYVITFNPVAHYITPPPLTNTLVSGGLLHVEGHYSFPDVNHNGISDLWEKQYFGDVAASHPPGMDTDHDGMSDLAEFLAGTDPTKPSSNLRLLQPAVQPDGAVVLRWTTVVDHQYRIWGSPDLQSWDVVRDWIDVRAGTTSTVIPASIAQTRRFFRVEVRP